MNDRSDISPNFTRLSCLVVGLHSGAEYSELKVNSEQQRSVSPETMERRERSKRERRSGAGEINISRLRFVFVWFSLAKFGGYFSVAASNTFSPGYICACFRFVLNPVTRLLGQFPPYGIALEEYVLYVEVTVRQH